MFFENEFADTIARAAILASISVVWVIVVVRIVGLRAFSKMTAFDFVITVATGSLMAGASTATSWSAFAQPCLAVAVLLGVQSGVAWLRQRSETFETIVQNCPVLLMRDGKMLHGALKATRVAEDDLVAKLREANVLNLSDVRAVVLETTGDISVLHGDTLSAGLLDSVREAN